MSRNTPQSIKKRINDIKELPSLPNVISKVLSIVDDPSSSISELEETLDISLTAKVLKLANSAYYNRTKIHVDSLRRALVVIGFDAVREIVLSTSFISLFAKSEENPFFDYNMFWQHSFACSIAARMMAGAIRYDSPGEAFTVGLIHDIGKLIFNQYFADEFYEINSLIYEKDFEPEQAEKEILNVTHAMVGSWLAEKWNLSSNIVYAIKFHHHINVDQRFNPVLIAIVHLANSLCKVLGVEVYPIKKQVKLDKNVWEVLKLNQSIIGEEHLEQLTDSFQKEYEMSLPLIKTVIGIKEEICNDNKA